MPDKLRRTRIWICDSLLAAVVVLILATLHWSSILQAKVPPQMTREELFGTSLRKSRWRTNTVQLCWENPDATAPAYRTIVRDAVTATWGKVTKPGAATPVIAFTGWDTTCTDRQPGLHIRIASGQPHTVAVGYYLNQRNDGMFLNFDIASWRPACKADPVFCIKAVAAHEFGHALGFTHEQKIANAPAECDDEPNDIIGDYLVTEYDLSSIMALCNPKWNANGQLSDLDKQALIRFYA